MMKTSRLGLLARFEFTKLRLTFWLWKLKMRVEWLWKNCRS